VATSDLRRVFDRVFGEDDEVAELLRLLTDWNSRRERRTTARRRSRSRKLEHVRSGYVMASYTAPYGVAFAGPNEKRTLEVRPEHMEVVKRIFRLVGVEGEGVRGVKKILDREGVRTPPNAAKDGHPERGQYWSRQFIRDVIAADVYKPHNREELAALVAARFTTPEVAEKAPDPGCVWWYTGKDYEGKTRRVAVPIPDAGTRVSGWTPP
jgi:hypothetical protein